MAELIDLGMRPFLEVWKLQKELVQQRIDDQIGDVFVLCAHPPVYTVGRRREALKNLLDVGDTPIYEIERGGAVTWHGPGQVVLYPILRMPEGDVLKHLRWLEQWMIEVAAHFGLSLERDARNAGVWHQGRKVGSVGVASRRGVSWHGLALNVNPDLSWFRRINPCGMNSELLSSMEVELGGPVEEEAVRRLFREKVALYGS